VKGWPLHRRSAWKSGDKAGYSGVALLVITIICDLSLRLYGLEDEFIYLGCRKLYILFMPVNRSCYSNIA
jgi:hypothetical protein